MAEKKSFWTTLPGILTGIAAVITAATGLYLALATRNKDLNQTSYPKSIQSTQRRDTESLACDENVKEAWRLIQAHKGELTDAVDDLLSFQDVVFDIGCLRHPYTIDLGGKQNVRRFTITVMNQWPYSPSPNKTYVYKEYVSTLELRDHTKTVHGRARRIKGSNGDLKADWELLD